MLTREVGLVDVLVNGMRKPANRYAGVLEPFNLVGVVLRSSRIYYMLEEAILVKPYHMLDKELNGLGLGNTMLEAVRQASQGDGGDNFFDLFNDYLLAYENNRSQIKHHGGLLIFLSSFLLSILAVAGRMPIIDGCWVCGRERNDVWQATVSGLSHRCCQMEDVVCNLVSPAVVEGLKVIESQPCAQLFEREWGEKLSKEIFSVVLFWYYSFYEKKMKSLDFLEEVCGGLWTDGRIISSK